MNMSKGVFPNPVHLANSNLFPNYLKTTALLIRLTCSFVIRLPALLPSTARVTHAGPHSRFKAKVLLGYYNIVIVTMLDLQMASRRRNKEITL